VAIRIGQGLDIHPFAKDDRPLYLGGVLIPNHVGLEGHSDADALIHAICDALLGALNLGDIGQHFPDTDPTFKGQRSTYFLETIMGKVRARGFGLTNLDATILTEAPRIKPHVEIMQTSLAKCMQVSPEQISLKATRPEKLGSLGRKEGLLVMCVVLLEAVS